jgi:putative transposase
LADAADRRNAGLLLRRRSGRAGALARLRLLDDEVQLLCTPPEGQALSRMMQAVGRRYVSAYNQRHRRSGRCGTAASVAPWCNPGATLLEVLCLIDGQAQDPIGPAPAPPPGTAVAGAPGPPVADPPEYWALGNTPFRSRSAPTANC